MKIVITSYSKSQNFTNPELWLEKINFYTGITERLAKHHEVVSIERINYEGTFWKNNVYHVFIRLKKNTNRFPGRMHQFIKKQRPDIVLINGLIFPLQVIQLRLKLGPAVKIILIHRAEKPFTGLKKILQKIADRFVNAYIFSSLEFGEYWVKKGVIKDIKKTHEIMSVSSSFYPTEKKEAKNNLDINSSPVFLWVGRFEKNKDPLTVVRAFNDFLFKNSSASLYMIYQTEELLDEVKKISGKTAGIKLVGQVTHENLQYWYNAADFIISGSHYEGGSIAVCEAMSCGCIPVVTDIMSFRSMTGQGKCGILYEPGNENALLSALIKTQTMCLEKEKEKVLNQFRKELSFDTIVKKIEQLIAPV